MIFVTVGTQIPFDRLMQMVDEIAPELQGEEIIAQSCDGKYSPEHFATVRFIEPAEFEEIFSRARVVIAHAGMGSIVSAMHCGKPLVVVPRRAALGEHRNDHQLATAEHFAQNCGVCVANSAAELLDAVRCAPVPASLPEGPSPQLITALHHFIDD